MEYTGITIRLPQDKVTTKRIGNKELQFVDMGDSWYVYETATMPSQEDDTHTQAHDTQSAIPLQERSQDAAQPNRERRKTSALNEILMPLILICILVMAIAAVGDYHTLESLPRGVMIPILVIGSILYLSYRNSEQYEKNGQLFKAWMERTHKPDGTIN